MGANSPSLEGRGRGLGPDPLAHAAPRNDRPDDFHAAVAGTDEEVAHVDGRADVIGDNRDAVAKLGPLIRRAIRQINEAVLLGHGIEARLGKLHHVPQQVQPQGLRRDGLRAGVENSAVGRRPG